MDKLLVTKDIFNALEELKQKDKYINFKDKNKNLLKTKVLNYHHDTKTNTKFKWSGDLLSLNEINCTDMAVALLVGYELIKTKDEILIEKYNYFQSRVKDHDKASGIEIALEILGIKVKGINS